MMRNYKIEAEFHPQHRISFRLSLFGHSKYSIEVQAEDINKAQLLVQDIANKTFPHAKKVLVLYREIKEEAIVIWKPTTFKNLKYIDTATGELKGD